MTYSECFLKYNWYYISLKNRQALTYNFDLKEGNLSEGRGLIKGTTKKLLLLIIKKLLTCTDRTVVEG